MVAGEQRGDAGVRQRSGGCRPHAQETATFNFAVYGSRRVLRFAKAGTPGRDPSGGTKFREALKSRAPLIFRKDSALLRQNAAVRWCGAVGVFPRQEQGPDLRTTARQPGGRTAALPELTPQ